MVASVGRITAGTGYEYLTREVATSKHDYYTGAGETPGKWAGRGAALLGLAGEVDADDMAALYGRFVVPSTAGGPPQRWPELRPWLAATKRPSTLGSLPNPSYHRYGGPEYGR